MPKIVELIGPSGTGKTAIYNKIRSEWVPEYNWVTYDDLNYKGRSLDRKRLAILYQKVIRFFTPLKNRARTQMRPEWKVIDHSNRTFLGDDFSSLKTGLMDLVEEHCKKGYDGSDKRFNTIYMIMWSIAHIDRIESAEKDNRYCILKQGEGFVSRIMHLNSPSFDEKALIEYMDIIPLPDVIVNLTVSVNEIMRRIRTRNRVSSIHKGMDENTIQLYTENTIKYIELAAEYAEKKGAKVIHVDVEQEVAHSTAKITDFLANS